MTSKIHILNYSPFGVLLQNRNFTSEKYRYGFNGMERDDEVKGEGNSYTTDYRFYDSRLGRWLSIDPVEHPFQSPFISMNNNPVNIYDPTGDDGEGDKRTGIITATIYLEFDGAYSEEEKQEYMRNLRTSIAAVWNQQQINGVQVNVDNVKILEAPSGMKAKDLKRNENLITVGNGSDRLPDYIRNTRTSYVDNNARNNTGYWFFKGGDPSSYAAHEFGHLLGLTDRYHYLTAITEGGCLQDRGTIGMELNNKKETGYNSSTNLMSSGGNTLTQYQLNIAFNRNKKERNYTQVVLMVSDAFLTRNDLTSAQYERGHLIAYYSSRINRNSGIRTDFNYVLTDLNGKIIGGNPGNYFNPNDSKSRGKGIYKLKVIKVGCNCANQNRQTVQDIVTGGR